MSDSPRIDPELVLWRTAPEGAAERPLLILLHGYGADEHDLFALAAHLPDAYDVAAVRAPLTPPWPSPGYSWYPIEGLGGRAASAVTSAAAARREDRKSVVEGKGV